jgi:hypothetical protein
MLPPAFAAGSDVPDEEPNDGWNLRAGKLVLLNLRNRRYCPQNYGETVKIGYDGSIAEPKN